MEPRNTPSPAPGAVHVLATTIEGTRAALSAAIPLARGSHARLIVIVTKSVPFDVSPDTSLDAHDFTMRQYRDLLNGLDGEAQLRLCLCRRPQDVVTYLLPRRATVVVGGSSGNIVPSEEIRLMRCMTRLGHHVVFVPTLQTVTSTFRSWFQFGE